MTAAGKILNTCDHGHQYYKSSDCPVCLICEADRKPETGFLSRLSNPARSALEHEGITTLQQLSTFTEREVLKLHGVGPKSIPTLRNELQSQGLEFKLGAKNKK